MNQKSSIKTREDGLKKALDKRPEPKKLQQENKNQKTENQKSK